MTGVASSKATGTYTQPTLTSTIDIYNSTNQSDMQTGLKYSTPVKITFGAPSGGSQTYTLSDAQGNPLGSGSIVPGQNNTLSLNVPMVDATGAPILGGRRRCRRPSPCRPPWAARQALAKASPCP